MWVPIAMGALGALQGINNEKRMEKNDAFRKAAIQYSPWTGMQDPGSPVLPGMLQSGLQGAATGMMGASMMGNAGLLGGAEKAAGAAAGGAGVGSAGAGLGSSSALASEDGMMSPKKPFGMYTSIYQP